MTRGIVLILLLLLLSGCMVARIDVTTRPGEHWCRAEVGTVFKASDNLAGKVCGASLSATATNVQAEAVVETTRAVAPLIMR